MTNLYIKPSSGCNYPESVADAVVPDSSMQKPGWLDSIIVELSHGLSLAGRH